MKKNKKYVFFHKNKIIINRLLEVYMIFMKNKKYRIYVSLYIKKEVHIWILLY